MDTHHPCRPDLDVLADLIDAELVRAGLRRHGTTTDPNLREAFGGAAVPFAQWLHTVYVPALRDVAAGRRPPPPRSQVWDRAVREWRMWGAPLAGVDDLLDLLHDADRAVEALARQPGP